MLNRTDIQFPSLTQDTVHEALFHIKYSTSTTLVTLWLKFMLFSIAAYHIHLINSHFALQSKYIRDRIIIIIPSASLKNEMNRKSQQSSEIKYDYQSYEEST
jgi:hypothetical protein